MQLFILIAGLVVLWWFRNAIRSVASLAENVVSTSVETTDDTLRTYSNTISINNAQTRSGQKKDIDKIDYIVTNDDIYDLLQSKKDVTNDSE